MSSYSVCQVIRPESSCFRLDRVDKRAAVTLSVPPLTPDSSDYCSRDTVFKLCSATTTRYTSRRSRSSGTALRSGSDDDSIQKSLRLFGVFFFYFLQTTTLNKFMSKRGFGIHNNLLQVPLPRNLPLKTCTTIECNNVFYTFSYSVQKLTFIRPN